MKATTQTLPQHDAEILIEITPAHYCKASETGEFLWLSSGWLELLGDPIAELLGRPFTDFVHPGDLERTYEAMGQLDKGLAVTGFCNRYRSADGSYVSLRWYVKALDGEYFAIATETGEEGSQNTLLNESLHLLEFAEELGEIGYWRVDLVQETLFWSQQVYRIHGLDPATYTPDMKTAIDAYHPEDRAAVQAHVETAIAERGAFDFALRIIRADGELRHIVSKGRTECNRDGQVVSLVGTFHDVTEWRQLQRRIQQAERLHSVSTLAAGVAHGINNPLQYVMASVALALEQIDSGVVTGNSIRDLLVDTQHGVEQVARIVRQLRSVVTDGTEKEPEPVDLLAVLSTTLSMTRSEVRDRAQLSEHLAELPRVMARSSELVQIFVNLITNAVHAIRSLPPTEALIRIRAFRRTDGWAVVEIEDNGIGIPKVDFVRVFEPFYTTKEVGEGTGLGLHVSRNIVQRYGGTIGVVSPPGKTCFKVAFPPIDNESEPEPLKH
ncbi:MAG: PAS domain-containing protein [Kofleriaceae bacterium]|nr:PAS domain-containing protein [Kofleriaceae bacterium]